MKKVLDSCVAEISRAISGKEQQVRLALCCLICDGHILIEDLPGMGKTTLAHALAKVIGLQDKRIQFTSDLLPADIVGVSIFEQGSSSFQFHQGPLFNQLILADEINRATPKTQSALLEAMEEGQVSVEGVTRPLPDPFFVIATQNPVTQSGTFDLPESQLDRFLMRIHLGYPDPAAEREILLGRCGRAQLKSLQQRLDSEQLAQARAEVAEVRTSDALLDYLQRLIAYTRDSDQFAWGLSTRGALALLKASQGWAVLAGRNYVVPEDVQAVLPTVVEHRLQESSDGRSQSGIVLGQRLLAAVDVLSG